MEAILNLGEIHNELKLYLNDELFFRRGLSIGFK